MKLKYLGMTLIFSQKSLGNSTSKKRIQIEIINLLQEKEVMELYKWMEEIRMGHYSTSTEKKYKKNLSKGKKQLRS